MTPFLREDWYLASLGRTLIWARLRVLERRLGSATSAEIRIGPVLLNTSTYKLSVQGQEVSLSKREYMLLKALMESA